MSYEEMLLFGKAAILATDMIEPDNASGKKYIGLEHIEPESLSLSGHGNAEDVASTKRVFRKGDILFGKLRPYFRKVIIAPFEGICSTDIWVVRANKGIDQSFLFYWMASRSFVDGAAHGSEGTRMPHAKWDYVSRFQSPIINPKEQKAIGEVLRSLDDNIKIKRKMCQTLEKTASTLFKSWFIDFDPVKAKSEGLMPEGMAPDLFLHFPDSFEDSKMGIIPSGWDVSSVYDWAEFINGATYKNSHFSDDDDVLPIIKIAELKNGIGPGTKYTKADFGNQYLLNTGDILFSWSGNPETSINTFLWGGGQGWINQHIFKVVPKKENTKAFCYFMLKSLKPIFIRIAQNKQTTGIGYVTVKDLSERKIVKPDLTVLQAYETAIRPIYERLQNNLEEITNLTKTRDTLLPKLIFGELYVGDVR